MKKEFIITRGESQFVLYAGLLDQAHEQGLKSICTSLLQVPFDQNGMVAIVRAEVETEKGTFTGLGDASPQNVSRMMVHHTIRMAETRAKARALRDAINVGVAALEEIADDDDQPAAPARLAPPPAQRQTASGKPVDAQGVIETVAPPKRQPAQPAQPAHAAAPAQPDGQPATEMMKRRVRDLAQRAGQTVEGVEALSADQAQWHISRLVEILNDQAKAKRPGNGTGH